VISQIFNIRRNTKCICLRYCTVYEVQRSSTRCFFFLFRSLFLIAVQTEHGDGKEFRE